MAVLVNELWTENDPTTDWDFYNVADWSSYSGWSFSTTQYVSAPSSILIGNNYQEVYALSKHTSAQNMTQGRITSWLMLTLSGVGAPYIYIGVTGSGSYGIRLAPFYSKFVWWRTRFTWWQGVDGEGAAKTLVLRELWENDAWTDKGTTYHDPMTGSTNRVGIGAKHQSINPRNRWDDTIIETGYFGPYLGGGPDIAVVETRLHWKKLDGTHEVYIQGESLGASTVPAGNIAVVEERIHYVDAYGDEKYWQGELIGDATNAVGNIASVEGRIHYVDTSQKERYIAGIPV